MNEHQKETFAKRLKTGEEPWIALVHPNGVSQEDADEAECYCRENGIHSFIHNNMAIVYYADESKLSGIKESVERYCSW